MKKVKYDNVDGLKMPYLEYQMVSTDGKRTRIQKRFLKQFSKCGLYEPSCKYLPASATTVKRWYEQGGWFANEVDSTFEFALEHYREDLEGVSPQRRHFQFVLHRVPYLGKDVYDNNLELITADEYIDENGDRQLTENAKRKIAYEEEQLAIQEQEAKEDNLKAEKEREEAEIDALVEEYGGEVPEYSGEEIGVVEYARIQKIRERIKQRDAQPAMIN